MLLLPGMPGAQRTRLRLRPCSVLSRLILVLHLECSCDDAWDGTNDLIFWIFEREEFYGQLSFI
jgi:hypothetical protein